MSFFHRMKLRPDLSRVTSDVEAVRIGIQDVGFVERDPARADGVSPPSC